MSTLPPQMLKKHFQRELFHIENALVVNAFSADRIMEDLACEILNRKEIHPYFYPDYLSKESLNTNIAEQLIELQDSFALCSGFCLTQVHSPVEFYYLSQRFLMYQKYILKTGKPLISGAFKSKYLIDSVALKCFKISANESDLFLEMNDEGCDYVIVIGPENELKMLVSI